MSLPEVAIYRVARPSLGKPVVSPLWGHERSIISQTRTQFLCRFDQFVKPSADDRYLRIPAIAVASDDKMYFRAGS
jgi:hypothetical protein